MPVFYSPAGNAESWAARPDGYMSEEEYQTAHPELFRPNALSTWDAESGSWAVDTGLMAAAVRADRDRRIEAMIWRVQRYESEVRQGATTTDDIAVLDAYLQALRDVPQQDGFPLNVSWPDVPAEE